MDEAPEAFHKVKRCDMIRDEMTFREFKDKFFEVRQNCQEVRSLYVSLKNLLSDGLTSSGISGGGERVQSDSSPDAGLVNAIFYLQQEERRICDRIKLLEESNKWAVDLLDSAPRSSREIIRLYYFENHPMHKVADRIEITERRCWQLWREGMYFIYINAD